MNRGKAWYGVDFDGTLVEYDGYQGPGVYGDPIGPMVMRVKGWLQKGRRVKIFTARVSPNSDSQQDRDAAQEDQSKIQDWCIEHLGVALEVTCEKDYKMIVLYDDRCRQVIKNTGKVVYRENT